MCKLRDITLMLGWVFQPSAHKETKTDRLFIIVLLMNKRFNNIVRDEKVEIEHKSRASSTGVAML